MHKHASPRGVACESPSDTAPSMGSRPEPRAKMTLSQPGLAPGTRSTKQGARTRLKRRDMEGLRDLRAAGSASKDN